MENIYILSNGLAVKLPSNLFTDLKFDIDGFLVSFNYNNSSSTSSFQGVYKFYRSIEFVNSSYEKNSPVPDGYYLESEVLKYFGFKQSSIYSENSVPTPAELKEIYCFKEKIFSDNYPPAVDDEVSIYGIASTEHDIIYEQFKAVFKIIKNPDDSIKRKYIKDNRIDFPRESTPENGFISYNLEIENFLESNNVVIRCLGYFYKKNFSERVIGWPISNDEKNRFDRITTLIIMRIYRIIDEIFPHFLNVNDWQLLDSVGWHTVGFEYEDLNSNLQKVLHAIKVSWAQYYIPDSTNPNLTIYQPILNPLPVFDDYQKYYNAVSNFYINTYRIKLQLSSKTEDEKLNILLGCLPASAINLIPIHIRINLLVDFAKEKINEDKENLILKIIDSIDPSDATEFLGKLQSITIYDGKNDPKLLEALYNKINDQVASFGKDNRKALMLKLFNLWYVSEYNPSLNTNDFEDITSNYSTIETELIGYTADTVMLNYNHEKFFGFYTDNMSFDFENGKIKVSEEKTQIVPITGPYQSGVYKYWENIGHYNYLQAISLSDYKENDVAIKIPLVDLNQNGQNVTALLPLFYLKYMDDFGDSEDLWTGIGLTFDVALTFTGIGNLTKLRHLRHLGKFGSAYRAWKTGAQTGEVLFVLKGLWQGAQGVAGLAEISSSFVSIYLSYMYDNCNDYKNDVLQNVKDTTPNGQLPNDKPHTDEALKEYNRCKKLDQIMFWIQIGSLGFDVLASKNIKKYSKELDVLGYPTSWNVGDYLQLKQKFQGINDAAGIDNFVNFINDIPVAYRNAVETKLLNDFTPQERLDFLDDFAVANRDDAFWQKMVNNSGEVMDNYRNLRVHNVIDATSFDIILDTALSNRYIQYYNVPSLKNQLAIFDDASRLDFLKSSLSQVTPLPGPGYLNAWLKIQKNGTLANFQTETFLRKFDDFSDELVDKAIYEIAHTGQRGSDVRRLIQANPEDIINQLKPILEDPYRLWSSKELFSPAWLRWRKSYFFKHVTLLGRKFEGIVSTRFAVRNSTEYNALQNWMTSNTIGKNLDDYDLITNVQLNYGNVGEYFIGDQVFVKFATDQYGKRKISDIIVIETKLKQTTATSINQKGAINAAYDNNFSGFELRNNERVSKFNNDFKIEKTSGNFKFNGQPTIIKAYDLDNGDEISGFKRLTNLDNN